MTIDPFQAEVARIALRASAEHGFALAGGNALVAHGIVERFTEDVDLFTPEEGGPGAVTGSVRTALEEQGFAVEVTRSPEAHRGEFARLLVTRGAHQMHLDLARDWRQWPPVQLEVGPVLHIHDAVGSKVTALLGRGLPRDFIDIAATTGEYSRLDLMHLAFARDPGLRVVDFAEAARRLDQLATDMFASYGLNEAAVAELRARFAGWPRDATSDLDGQALHRLVAAEATGAAPPTPGKRSPEARAPHAGSSPGVPGNPVPGVPLVAPPDVRPPNLGYQR